MVIFNYKIENFISNPTQEDKQLKIFNKYGVPAYNINPDVAYFFYKNNNIIIKIEDKEDIILDFKSNTEAVKALSKLNDIKKQISLNISDNSGYYLKTELDNGVLDSRYYTSAQTDTIFSVSSHTHNFEDSSNVIISGLTINDVISYNGTNWVNSSFTFDLSSWENNYYSTAQTITILSGYSLTSHTHDNLYYEKSQFSGYTSGYTIDDVTNGLLNDAVLDDRYFVKALFNHTDPGNGAGILDDRYYTKIKIDELYPNKTEINNDFYTSAQTNDLLSTYYTSSQTDNLYYSKTLIESDFAKIIDVYTKNEIDTNFNTKSEINLILSGYSLTSHTHSDYYHKNELYTSAQTNDLLNNYLTSAQTDVLYYSKVILDSDFAKKIELDNYITLNGSSGITGSLIPATNGTIDLGSPTNQWKSLYVSASTIYIDNQPISIDNNGDLIVNGNIMINEQVLSAHTHDNLYYEKSQFSGDTSGYTIDDVTNVLLNDAVLDNRYFVKALFNHTDPGNGAGILDDRYWTKIALSGGTLDWRYLKSDALDNYYTTAQTFSSAQTLSILSGYSLTSHTHSDLYYEKTEFKGDSIGYNIDQVTNGLLNDAVLDGRYFNIALFNHTDPGHGAGILDDRYCTKICLEDMFNNISGGTGADFDKIYYGYEDVSLPNNSTEIKKLFYLAENKPFRYIIKKESSYTAFYVKGEEKIFSATHVQSNYSEQKYGFNVIPVYINIGGTDVLYHKYEQYIGGIGYQNDATYEVTLFDDVYHNPGFSLFNISGISNVMEYGDFVSGGIKIFNWLTINNSNILSNTINISGPYINDINNSENDFSENIYMSGFTNVDYSIRTTTWEISALNTQNEIIKRNMTITWKNKMYYGNSVTSLPNTSNQILLLNMMLDDVTFRYTVEKGNQYTAFYLKGDEYSFSVKNVESAYSEEKYGFVVSQVTIDGDIYHKYEQHIGGVGYPNDATYEVTIL